MPSPAIAALDQEVGPAAPDCATSVGDRVDAHHLAVALELPWRHGAAREAAAQARVLEQVARMRGPAMRREIVRRGGGREALDARTDRHRDHVLLEPLVVADAGVAAAGEHVDETVLDDHLQPDLRIGLEERRR